MRYVAYILGLWLFAATAQISRAAAPMVKTQAPGFYRLMLGNFEVTALNDGVVAYPTTQVLPHATPEQIKNGLAESGLTDPVRHSLNFPHSRHHGLTTAVRKFLIPPHWGP